MIYVVTPVHNRYSITERFVDQLTKQTYRDITLLLVDDGSTDHTSEMVKNKMPSAIIFKGNGNLWWGGSLHKAYKWLKKNGSSGSYVMFANDDTSFDCDYIEKAINFLKNRNKVLLTGCGISMQTDQIVDGAVDYNLKELKTEAVKIGTGNCASTHSLFFRLEDLLKIGGFHPFLLPHYGSDYEWTIRACRKYGYTVYCDQNIKYLLDEETTGENQYDKMNRNSIFKKRSSSNPIYKFTYLILVTPIQYAPRVFVIQIMRYFKKSAVIVQILKRG